VREKDSIIRSMETTINVTCKAAINIPLEDLAPLQGDLKELTHRNFEKLKRSIMRHGISFPFFVWQKDGINYVLDGHQRDRTLLKMQKQGYQIPPLPCALIEAEDRKQAAEKILLVSSQYGRMTEQSLEAFLAENELEIDNLLEEVELPSLDMRYFGSGEFEPTDENDQGRLDKKNPVTCPECGHEFTP
jgi:hypothetical protein